MERLHYMRLSLRQRMMIWGLLILFAVTALCVVAVIHMKPIITSMATARVSNTVNHVVADAVNDAVDKGEINYEAMVRFEKDEQGRVTALYSNMAEFNRLQTTLSDEILQRLSEVPTSELYIPVGSLTGSSLLAGRGPCIRVRMQAVGSTQCSFRNAFTAAGINQTKHQVLLDVNVYMNILLPGFTASTEVKNEIAVAETIIVGSVPENYTYFSTVPDEIGQYAEDYIMNNG